MAAVYERLAEVLITEFDVDPAALGPDVPARNLDLDSLAMLELAVIVAEETGVKVEEMQLGPDVTLGQIADQFVELLASQKAGEAGTALPV